MMNGVQVRGTRLSCAGITCRMSSPVTLMTHAWIGGHDALIDGQVREAGHGVTCFTITALFQVGNFSRI